MPAQDPARKTYPPRAEVLALLAAGRPTADDEEARAILEARALDSERVDDLGLARVVAHDAILPRWAKFGGQPWTETGHRLLVPVVDARGDVRSVRAWRVVDGDTPKRIAPSGCSVGGLVLACPSACAMLAGDLEGLPSPLRVVVAEGEPDFLTWATRFSDADEDAPVVIGVAAGSWSADLGSRIPDGARVTIWTDHDAAGEKYAQQVAATIALRCTVLRAPRLEAA